MISMELPPAVHLQHLNHNHGLTSSQHHHSGLMQHQHQTCLSSIQDDKQKSELSFVDELNNELYLNWNITLEFDPLA